ncbi:MAG: ROK family protein, glucokinase [candidate division WWE3 bacterium CSP1-7]|uniref:ROK family protein, glucokinase n=1 Tax=candidate division WWE3 bacterium CSP1-7 TaxID=1576480 RepID=A0A0T5ZY09_UNCKA|nr:MAG: ROK family protein, glucokinase [candidate division WWE3 bacterium CSP1-7]
MPTLGIDVGASKVRYVIWEGNQALLDEEVKLPAPGREELGRVFQEISQKIKETKVSTVGVGLPGTVEEEMVTYAPNFPTLLEWDFKPELEKLLNAPVRLFNDAKAFVFAEVQAGAAKGKQNVVGLTLGSGLGGGIVFNGALYLGKGTAGEVGHEIVDLPNRREAEDFASAKFFQKFGKSPDELRQLAEDGDQTAKQAFNEFGKNLGTIIANLVNLLDPEVIVLGGGIAGAYDFFIEETKKAAAGLIVNPSRKNIEIKKAALGNSAGAIGAAILAKI